MTLFAATDALGVPLLKKEMKDIWEEQMHHIPCLQDPPAIQLYTVTGRILKGGVSLPIYRYARGTTHKTAHFTVCFFNLSHCYM